MDRLLDLYGILDVSVGWMSGDEADWFSLNGRTTPAGYRRVDQIPVVQQSWIHGKGVAIILFPEDDSPAMMGHLTRLADSLRSRNALIIGVSPWGTGRERIFLETAAGHYDVLLGGGPGGGMRGNMA